MPKKKMPTIQEIYKSEINEILEGFEPIQQSFVKENSLFEKRLQFEQKMLQFELNHLGIIQDFIDISNDAQFSMEIGNTIWEQESNKLKDSLDSLLKIDNVNEFYQNIYDKMIEFFNNINKLFKEKFAYTLFPLFNKKEIPNEIKTIFEKFRIVNSCENGKVNINLNLDPSIKKQDVVDGFKDYLDENLFNSIKKRLRLNDEKTRKEINFIHNQINSLHNQIDSIQCFKKILQELRETKNFKDISSFRKGLSEEVKQLKIKLPKHKVALENLAKKIEGSFKSEICYHIKFELSNNNLYQDNKEKLYKDTESIVQCFKESFSSLLLDDPGFYSYAKSIVKDAIKENNKKGALTKMVQEKINNFKKDFYQLQYKYKQVIDFIDNMDGQATKQNKYILNSLVKELIDSTYKFITEWIGKKEVGADDLMAMVVILGKTLLSGFKERQIQEINKKAQNIDEKFFRGENLAQEQNRFLYIFSSIQHIKEKNKTGTNITNKERDKFFQQQNRKKIKEYKTKLYLFIEKFYALSKVVSPSGNYSRNYQKFIERQKKCYESIEKSLYVEDKKNFSIAKLYEDEYKCTKQIELYKQYLKGYDNCGDDKQNKLLREGIEKTFKYRHDNLFGRILNLTYSEIKKYKRIPFLSRIFKKTKFRNKQAQLLLNRIEKFCKEVNPKSAFVDFLKLINNAISKSIKADGDKYKNNWKNKRSKYRDILNQTKKLLFKFCPKEQLRDLMQQEKEYINKVVFEKDKVGILMFNDEFHAVFGSNCMCKLKTENSSDPKKSDKVLSINFENNGESVIKLLRELSIDKEYQKERKIGFSYLFDGLFGYYNTILDNISSLQKPDEQKCDTPKTESSLVLEQDEDTKKDKNNKKKKVKQPEEGNRLREPDSDKKENDT
ncbi:MAG: hypothetical protein PVG30_07115, partial [Gammaproteobacteria bacterium]